MYTYGLNGKEKDQNGEWGAVTNYDYGFRIYNPGIGKFLSVDPLTKSYPMLTPYQFASNRPIDGIDLDGLEYFPSPFLLEQQGRTLIEKTGDKEALDKYNKSMQRINTFQFYATVVPNAVAIDLYLTKGQITKQLLNQFKTQLIANTMSEILKITAGKSDIPTSIIEGLKKSVEGVDAADAIIGVFVGNQKLANVFASMVDISFDADTKEIKLTSLVEGKEPEDIAIDLALNFLTDNAGDKIKNTKFSPAIKEAFNVAGVDIGGFIKEFFNSSTKNSGEQFVPTEKLIESDATRYDLKPKIIKQNE